jgi:hypothetical protein
MAGGPIPYQFSRLVLEKFYVCEIHCPDAPAIKPPCDRRLLGPFDSEVEALSAAAAFEAIYAYYRSRTEVWQNCLAETEALPVAWQHR